MMHINNWDDNNDDDDRIYREDINYRKPLKQIDINNKNNEFLDWFNNTNYSKKNKINHDRLKLMELFDNSEYDNLLNLLSTDMLDIEQFKIEKHTEMLDLLYTYCIENNDIEFINKVIEKFGTHNIFRNMLICNKIMKCNSDMLNIICEMECFKCKEATVLFPYAINTGNVDLIIKLESVGHQMDSSQLSQIIFSNNTKLIEHIKSKGVDLQNIFDNCKIHNTMSWLNTSFVVTEYFHKGLNIDSLKCIMDFGIDISSKLNELVYYSISEGNIELLKFCHELGNFDIDSAIKQSCETNKVEILEYLLQFCGNIQIIDYCELHNANYQLVELLLNNNYIFSRNRLHYIFRKVFVESVDMNEINKLFEHVKSFNYIFHREISLAKNMPQTKDICMCANSILHGNNNIAISDLELLVQKNKFEHIKMIVTYAMDKFKLELDRLIIIAIANGHLEMTEYFLELGATINYNLAMKVACFFGHIHMLKYLLNFNNNLAPELFLITAYGSSKINSHIGYAKLIENNTIFRNDVFNFGESYIQIFQLLMENNVSVPDLKFFEILYEKYYSTEIVSHMINLGVDPNIILEICIKNNKSSIIEYLLENGAKI